MHKCSAECEIHSWVVMWEFEDGKSYCLYFNSESEAKAVAVQVADFDDGKPEVRVSHWVDYACQAEDSHTPIERQAGA